MEDSCSFISLGECKFDTNARFSGLKKVDDPEKIEILHLRTQIAKTQIETICAYHERMLIDKFSFYIRKCCDPLGRHPNVCRKKSLKIISLSQWKKFIKPPKVLVPGSKLCLSCHISMTAQHLVKDHVNSCNMVKSSDDNKQESEKPVISPEEECVTTKSLKPLHELSELQKKLVMGHHKAVLMRMCRICGMYCNDLKIHSAIRFMSTLAEEAKALGVDTSNDDPDIHPPSMCKRCIDASEKTGKEEISTAVQIFQFSPHEEENCGVCKFPCSACLLIPASSSVPAVGGLRHYALSDEQAVKERHRALVKSMIQLSSKLSPVKCESKTLGLYTEEHCAPCKVCDAPCPLCGMTLQDATDLPYVIRCRLIAGTTRVLRTRKRKIPVYDDDEEIDVPNAKTKKAADLGKGPTILPKVKDSNGPVSGQSNTITFTAGDGKTYTLPVVTNNHAKSKAIINKITQASDKLNANKFVWPVTPLNNKVVTLSSSIPANSIFSPAKFAAMRSPSAAASTQVFPDKNMKRNMPPLGPISSRHTALKPAPEKHKYTTHNVVVQGKSVARRSIEFGMAPRAVAKTFHDLYKKHCSLSACIRQALSMAPLLKYKYNFINPGLASEQCILIGVLSDRDTDALVNAQLQRLDKFVKENHLASRASAIEELLYSPLQNAGQAAINDAPSTPTIAHKDSPMSSSPNMPTLPRESDSPEKIFEDQVSEQMEDCSKLFSCDMCKTTLPTISHFNRHCETSSHKLAVLAAINKTSGRKKEAKKKEEDVAKAVESTTSTTKVTRNYSDLLHQSYHSASLSSGEPAQAVYKCYICAQELAGNLVNCQLRFMRHLWKHRNSLRFPCTWCGRKFNSPSHMRLHIMKKSCTKQANDSSSLAESKKLHRLTGKYTGIVPHHYKPFTMQKAQGDQVVSVARCKFCPFVSKDVMAIVCHGRKHVGDYPFRCSKCVYCAVSKAKLVAHQQKSGHEGFYIIKRSYPLNAAEIEKLDSMVRRKLIVFNSKGCLEASSSSRNGTADLIAVEDDDEAEEESSAALSDKEAWNFCKLCNSAFLDKATYESHTEHCNQNTNSWPRQDDSKDGEDFNEEISDEEVVSMPTEVEVDEQTPQTDKLSILDKILAHAEGTDDDHQGPSGIDSLPSSSTENPLIAAPEINRRSRRKMKPQKRNRLLDVIAGLSAGNSGRKVSDFSEENSTSRTSSSDVDLSDAKIISTSPTAVEEEIEMFDEAPSESPTSGLMEKNPEIIECQTLPQPLSVSENGSDLQISVTEPVSSPIKDTAVSEATADAVDDATMETLEGESLI